MILSKKLVNDGRRAKSEMSNNATYILPNLPYREYRNEEYVITKIPLDRMMIHSENQLEICSFLKNKEQINMTTAIKIKAHPIIKSVMLFLI
ncbi:hypothetical protein D1872_299800 [compost metagenome]